MGYVSITQTRNQLSYRPPNRQHRQDTARGMRQKLKKQRAIYRQVSANTNTKSSIHPAGTDPAIGASDSKSKDSGDEEGGVEGGSSADNIRRNAPEGGADAQADKGGACSITDLG